MRDFLHALLQHWVALMSGIASLVLSFWEKVWTQNVGKRVFLGVSALCFFVAFYCAWEEQHQARFTADSLGAYYKWLSDIKQETINRQSAIKPLQQPLSLGKDAVSVGLANGTLADGAVAISSADFTNFSKVAIGRNAEAGAGSIAIGQGAKAGITEVNVSVKNTLFQQITVVASQALRNPSDRASKNLSQRDIDAVELYINRKLRKRLQIPRRNAHARSYRTILR
jgi:hypothetical protein